MIPIWRPKRAALATCLVEFTLKEGALRGAGLNLRAAWGRAGIRREKIEGDGATPAGVLRLMRVLYRPDRLAAPRSAVPATSLSPEDAWCDDPADPAYNCPVRRPYGASHEALWRDDAVYDIIGVLDWNLGPIVAGRGSAIFLHLATPDYTPTAGCIALSPPDLQAALAKGLRAIHVSE